jgi:hypothetical protein
MPMRTLDLVGQWCSVPHRTEGPWARDPRLRPRSRRPSDRGRPNHRTSRLTPRAAMGTFDEAVRELLSDPRVSRAAMFGHPAVKTAGSVFAMEFAVHRRHPLHRVFPKIEPATRRGVSCDGATDERKDRCLVAPNPLAIPGPCAGVCEASSVAVTVNGDDR